MSEDLVKKLTLLENEQESIRCRTLALSDKLNEFESDSVSKHF